MATHEATCTFTWRWQCSCVSIGVKTNYVKKVYKYFAQDGKVMIVYPFMWDFAGKMYSEQHFYRFSLCAVFRAHFPNTSLKDYYYFWNNTVQIYYYLFINYYIILYIF